MSTPSENANPALVEALMRAEESGSQKKHINDQIVSIGKAMMNDDFVSRSVMYNRNRYTIGALLAYEDRVRQLARRGGVNLDDFDEMITNVQAAVLVECTKSNPIGQKIAKTIKDLYANGLYR